MRTNIHRYTILGVMVTALIFLLLTVSVQSAGDGDKLGTVSYDNFETPDYCGSSCHTDIYRQWQKSMMSQSYTHHWDEIEYFELAVPHAEKDEMVAGVKAGCNGCHAPLSYLAGDVPPPRPEEGSRANEGVSCDLCHSITGITEDTAYNFNWTVSPGDVKYGPRDGATIDSPNHKGAKSEFLATTEFCGGCHNEKSPYGVWVKSTQLEWMAGPYAEDGTRCHDCHMTYTEAQTASMGNTYPDAAQHLFHGAHVTGKVQGTVEVLVYSDLDEIVPGEPAIFKVALFNQKTGHKFPTGSVEDRIVWLHVEATDADGNVFHLPVDKKGFDGEEYTISTDVLAYQDMGIPLDKPNFEGVQRDGVPFGDRIFRMPYFDPQGRMTIQQWNTASLGVDYRMGPRETKLETFTWNVPFEVAPGPLTVTATLNYCRVVPTVAKFLNVPEDETEVIVVNQNSATVEVLP